MAFIKIHNLGAVGIIKDVPAHELPPEAWTDGVNVRFLRESAEKIDGNEEVYNLTVSASTATQAIAESPWWLLPVPTEAAFWWVYAGKNNVHVAGSGFNSTNINKLDSTASATLLYSSTPTLRWTGGILAGLPIMTNGADPPQVWDPPSLSQRLVDLQWDKSAGTSWATRTAGAVTCHVMRTYREFAVALRTTEGGASFPRRVRWSHPATAATQPDSWDDSRTDRDAGYIDLDDTNDFVVDCKTLRNTNFIYKENYTWTMTFVGGQFVHSFQPAFQFGMLAHSCVVEIFNTHLLLTSDRDIVRHDGQSAQSMIEHKWRRYLNTAIDTDYSSNCFVATDYVNQEILFCYPESGVSEPYWCTMALVWNWRHDTWYLRDLPKASYIANGVIQGAGAGNLTWDAQSGSWDSSTLTWDQRNFSEANREMLLAYPEDSASAGSTPKLFKMNSTNQFDGASFTARIERTGLALAGMDLRGNPRIDLHSLKLINGLWLAVDAPAGTVLTVYVGSQMHQSEAVTWNGPYTFTVGTDSYINCRVMTRFIGLRIQTASNAKWKVTGYEVDLNLAGRY